MCDIEISGVKKLYAGDGVKGVSAEFKSGVINCIAGAKGSGKTLLLKLIAGLERPKEGKILLGGKDVSAFTAKERNVSMLFSNHSLFKGKTVRKNLEYIASLWGIAGERIDYAADFAGISELLEVKAKNLSDIQKFKTEIARAYLRDTKVVLLDEPFNRATKKEEIYSLIDGLKRRGKAVVITSDDIRDALEFSDSILVLNDGHSLGQYSPKELTIRPPDLFSAKYIKIERENEVKYAENNLFNGKIENGILTVSDGIRFEGFSETDREVTVCINPSDIVLSEEGKAAEVCFIEEFLDKKHVFLDFSIGGFEKKGITTKFTLITDKPFEDNILKVVLQKEKLNIFDKAAGINLNFMHK